MSKTFDALLQAERGARFRASKYLKLWSFAESMGAEVRRGSVLAPVEIQLSKLESPVCLIDADPEYSFLAVRLPRD